VNSITLKKKGVTAIGRKKNGVFLLCLKHFNITAKHSARQGNIYVTFLKKNKQQSGLLLSQKENVSQDAFIYKKVNAMRFFCIFIEQNPKKEVNCMNQDVEAWK
jgi:hypothetical protein